MATTTVRIRDHARSRLEDLANAHDQSLSATLTSIIERAWWEEACRQERAARLADMDNPALMEELGDWDQIGEEDLG